MKLDIESQNTKLNSEVIYYRAQLRSAASEAMHAQHALWVAHEAIFGLIKNIETVRYLADHDMKALRGLGCLPFSAIPDEISHDSEAWASIMAFRKAIIN